MGWRYAKVFQATGMARIEKDRYRACGSSFCLEILFLMDRGTPPPAALDDTKDHLNQFPGPAEVMYHQELMLILSCVHLPDKRLLQQKDSTKYNAEKNSDERNMTAVIRKVSA